MIIVAATPLEAITTLPCYNSVNIFAVCFRGRYMNRKLNGELVAAHWKLFEEGAESPKYF